MSESDPPPALLRVVNGGAPTAAELAALVTVVAAAAAASTGSDPAGSGSRWADRAAALRRPLPRGPRAWSAYRIR